MDIINLDTAVLAIGALAALLVLYRWQRGDDTFDLRWLIVDSKSGHVSLFKTGQAVALLASTWVLIYQTRHEHLTEWLFGTYMLAWAGANVARRLIDKDKETKP